MSKRPTDHLEPSAKRRTDAQLTKDDFQRGDDEEELDPGTFQKADQDTLKKRTIVRVSRRGVPEVKPVESTQATTVHNATGANPFAGVSLSQPTGNPFASVALTGANPFSGISLLPKLEAIPPTAAASVPGQTAANVVSGGDTIQSAAHANEEPKEGVAPQTGDGGQGPPETPPQVNHPNKDEPTGDQELAGGKKGATTTTTTTASPSATPSSAATTQTPSGFAAVGGGFSTLASGSIPGGFAAFSSAANTGFGGLSGVGVGLGALGSPPGSTSTSPTTGTKPLFGFAPGASTSNGGSIFPDIPLFSTPGPAGDEDTSVFGATRSTPAALSTMPEEPTVTGTEDETCVFSGDGTLFEFDTNKEWRERGRGELRLNVNEECRGRMVMWQRGNMKLLFNANLYPTMTVTTMLGGKAVTFACMNAAVSSGLGGSAKEGSEEGDAAAAPEAEAEGNSDKPAEAQGDGSKEEGSDGVKAGAQQLQLYAIRLRMADKVKELMQQIDIYKCGTRRPVPAGDAWV